MLTRILPTLVAVLAVAGFLRLGVWQLDRAEEKRALIAAYEDAESGSVTAMGQYRRADRYQRILIRGRFREAPNFLLDNQVRDRSVGVHLISIFEPDAGGPLLLVNRGWLPLGPRREPPPIQQRGDRLELNGMLSEFPRTGIRLGEVELEPGKDSYLLPYLDAAAVSDLLKSEVAPQILLSTEPESGPMIRAWRPTLMPPEKHQAYAFQWFTLATAVAVIWGLLTWRNRRRERP